MYILYIYNSIKFNKLQLFAPKYFVYVTVDGLVFTCITILYKITSREKPRHARNRKEMR